MPFNKLCRVILSGALSRHRFYTDAEELTNLALDPSYCSRLRRLGADTLAEMHLRSGNSSISYRQCGKTRIDGLVHFQVTFPIVVVIETVNWGKLGVSITTTTTAALMTTKRSGTRTGTYARDRC